MSSIIPFISIAASSHAWLQPTQQELAAIPIWRILSGFNQHQSALEFYEICEEAILDSHSHPLSRSTYQKGQYDEFWLRTVHSLVSQAGDGMGLVGESFLPFPTSLPHYRPCVAPYSMYNTYKRRALRSRPWEEAVSQFLIWSMNPESCLCPSPFGPTLTESFRSSFRPLLDDRSSMPDTGLSSTSINLPFPANAARRLHDKNWNSEGIVSHLLSHSA